MDPPFAAPDACQSSRPSTATLPPPQAFGSGYYDRHMNPPPGYPQPAHLHPYRGIPPLAPRSYQPQEAADSYPEPQPNNDATEETFAAARVQGRRGVLPSAPGRVAAPAKGTKGAKNAPPQPLRNADGYFPCPYCTKTYKHAKHLKRHHLRHTGDRPYMCALCKEDFSRSDILKRHFAKCSLRRGNPDGVGHLTHAQPHLKKNGSTSQMSSNTTSGSTTPNGPIMTSSSQHHSLSAGTQSPLPLSRTSSLDGQSTSAAINGPRNYALPSTSATSLPGVSVVMPSSVAAPIDHHAMAMSLPPRLHPLPAHPNMFPRNETSPVTNALHDHNRYPLSSASQHGHQQMEWTHLFPQIPGQYQAQPLSYPASDVKSPMKAEHYTSNHVLGAGSHPASGVFPSMYPTAASGPTNLGPVPSWGSSVPPVDY
ncbi:MAG: hypothetical protein M1825_001391 [Sarcosagium campestre]|nr:MAG: hypothetical protein M1825_001391 [Sarcosagium campestre]